MHARRNCNVFLSLSACARWDIVKGKGWCLWCLGHSADKNCFAIRRLEQDGKKPECEENGCKQPHHPALHHVQGNLSSYRLEVVECPVETASKQEAMSVIAKYYLIPQVDVVTVGGLTAVVQYDSGSLTSSVSARFAKQQGIRGQMCDVIMEDGLSLSGTRVTEVHELPVQSLNGVVFRQFF